MGKSISRVNAVDRLAHVFALACVVMSVCLHASEAICESTLCTGKYNLSSPTLASAKEIPLLPQIQQDASQGDVTAVVCLADLYLLGWGVEPDEKKAWVLFQQAAQAGHPGAMHRIGSIYEQGIAVEKDLTKALQWHMLSAKLGFAEAQTDVGIFYEDGLAGKKDIDAALFWYKKAARQGDPFAIEALRRLALEK